MEILYKVEKKGKALLVRLQEKGKKRVLYLDTLKSLAKEIDKPALQFLVKIHRQTSRNMETLSFEKIEVPPSLASEAFCLMEKTGRLILDTKSIDLEKSTPPIVEEKLLSKEVKLEPLLELKPILILKDPSGCFADLWIDYGIQKVSYVDFSPTVNGKNRLKKEEVLFEKDLLEAGYIRKIMEGSHYFCPSHLVKEALSLLMDVGWKIEDPFGLSLKRNIEIKEVNGKMILKGPIRSMLDQKIQTAGVWEKDKLVLKKSQVGLLMPLLQDKTVSWEPQIQTLIQGLEKGASLESAVIPKTFKACLLPYQQKGVDWLKFLYKWGFSALLADEMGLGKTVQVLAFLAQLETNLPVLIVAPTSLLFNWRAEIAKFLPSFTNYRLISYADLRLKTIDEEFEVIVLDESNAIKTESTQTAKKACQLKGRFKICMSGTPMENRFDEIWSQFHFLMPDLVDRNQDTLKSQIRPFILRRLKEEVAIDLPEKVEQTVFLEMTEDQKETYESYKKGIKLDGFTKMEVLEAILRLRQIAADPRLVGVDHEGTKINLLKTDVGALLDEGRKVLVFSQFTSMLRLIQKEFPEALFLDGSTSEAKRGELVKEFQEGEGASLFLLSLKAGGVGLNLTAADYVFLFDPWWNEAVERQAIDRAHRIGRKGKVIAKRYILVETVEEKILQLKEKKQLAADQLLDQENFTYEELFSLLQ